MTTCALMEAEAYEVTHPPAPPYGARLLSQQPAAALCQVMMAAHQNGMGVVGIYGLERATSYVNKLRAAGLTSEMRPTGDDD